MRKLYSNFSPNNFLFVPKLFIANNNFQFIINCKTVHGTGWNTLLSRHDYDGDFGLNGNNYFYWDEAYGETSFQPINNQRYWIALIWTGTKYYFYYMIDDGSYDITTLPTGGSWSNWTLVCNSNRNDNIYNNMYLDLGNWKKNQTWENYPWLGDIDIYNTKILADNSVWFYGRNLIENGYYNTGCTITSGVASNFSSSQYIKLNPIEPNFNSKNFKGIIRAYFSETTNSQDLFSRSSNLDRCWCLWSSNNSSYPNHIDYYNGSSHISNSAFVTNNWYWFGYEWDGTTYKFYSMLDDERYASYKQLPAFSNSNWTLECSFDDTNNLYETGIVLGYNIPANDWNRYWRGQIDLNNTIIGNNIINYRVSKEGYITVSDCKAISQDTTDTVTLASGVKLTIVPDQSGANVKLWADGYLQTDGTNTLTAVEGTEVHYKVSKSKYKTVSGTYTLGLSDYDLPITMEYSPVGEDPQWTYGSWSGSSIHIIPAEDNAIRGIIGNCSSINSEGANNPAIWTNGIIDENATCINSYATLTYTFNEPTDIKEIRIYSRWDSGRDGIHINSITYNNGNENITIPNSSVDYDPGTGRGYAYLKDSVEGALLAVDAVSFTIYFGNQDNDHTGYSEFEVRKI